MFVAQVDPQELLDTCGEEPGWWCERVLEWTGNGPLAVAADWLFARPLTIILVLALAWVANRLVRRGINRFVVRMAGSNAPQLTDTIGRFTPGVLQATSSNRLRAAARAETIGGVLKSVSTFVIWGLAVLTVLGELNINLGPLLAGAGVAGVALGFGAQSLVKDFLSGMFMLIEDQYGVGDVIDVGEAIGVVEGLTLRTTRLRALDGAVWHVPNGEIRRVGNMSQQWSRALLDIDVAYGTDLDHAQEVIMRVADEIYRDPEWTKVILEPPEIWGVERLGADGISIRLVLKTKPGEQWGLQRHIRLRMKDAFDAEGIEIPFPQRSVWVRSAPPGESGVVGDVDAPSATARPSSTASQDGADTEP